MYTKLYIVLLSLAFVLLMIVACTGKETATVGLGDTSGETKPLDPGDIVITTAVAVESAPTSTKASPTSLPLPITAKPTLPLDSRVSPLQLEPTATPTITPPTPSSTPTPVPTSSIIPGWLTYENKFLGYSFSYPPEGTIGHHGTTEIPPENVTTRREYLAWEETVTPNNLCVGVSYKTGFVTVGPMDETLSLYASPCGITGIGDYTIENFEEIVTIDGRSYTASGHRLYLWQTNQLESEFYILLDVNDQLRIDFGVDKMGAPQSRQPEVSEQEFNEIRETLLQILASFRFFPPQTGDG